MWRIALAGPEATGKTTLARSVAEQLHGQVSILHDLRPDLLRVSGCHTLFEASRFAPVWQQLLERQLQREAENADSGVIIDTCAIDYWAMWQRWGWGSAPVDLSEQLYARTREAFERYGTVVLFPSQQLGPPVGSRFMNPAYARQMRRLMNAFVGEALSATTVVDLDGVQMADYADTVLAAL